MNYWQKRQFKILDYLTGKSIRATERQLRKYYREAMERVLADFEATYDKILLAQTEGREPTPADLYKLDKYWQAQAQMRTELRKLGEKEMVLFSKQFEENWFEIYHSVGIPGDKSFNTVDNSMVRQMINSIWCADGKSWSQRIWDNTNRLAQTLNEGLIHCVATGKKTTELKAILQERFNVSYSRADTLVRTELTHIQTEAAKKRYEDAGLTYYEILGNEDDSCGSHSVDCHKMNGKKFLYSEMVAGKNAPPFHPNCRCCIMPVIEDDEEEKILD